jgi:hypothetical protein
MGGVGEGLSPFRPAFHAVPVPVFFAVWEDVPAFRKVSLEGRAPSRPSCQNFDNFVNYLTIKRLHHADGLHVSLIY